MLRAKTLTGPPEGCVLRNDHLIRLVNACCGAGTVFFFFFFFLKIPKLNYMLKSRTVLDRRWSAFLRV